MPTMNTTILEFSGSRIWEELVTRTLISAVREITGN
jgi:hypothetical protein